MKQVEIPNDYFFKMACKDYYDWPKALVREFIQNSVDAGASEIKFYYDNDCLTVTDNGCGMDMTIIENALLTLGGSHKESVNAVGGLGKAKEILYFSWPEWEIMTNEILIKGQGCRYQIDSAKPHAGVMSRIKIGDRIPHIENVIRNYVDLCCLTGTMIYFNDDAVKNRDASCGKKIWSIEGLGDLYENLSGSNNQVIVQAHGLFMFSSYSALDKGYIFNITMPSYGCLTANRDGFIGTWNDQFSQMIGIVAIDTESSHLRREHIIHVQSIKSRLTAPVEETLEGVRCTALGATFASSLKKTADLLTVNDIQEFVASGYAMTEDLIDKATGRKLRTLLKAAKVSKLFDGCLKWYKDHFREGFIIVSEEQITTPIIQSLYTRETLQLTILWKQIVDSIAQREDIAKCYGYGIVIAADTIARCQDGYLLYNPRVFAPLAWEEVALKMLVSASEELVHFSGINYHNETFKCRFSDVLERALQERVIVDDFLSDIRKVRKN